MEFRHFTPDSAAALIPRLNQLLPPIQDAKRVLDVLHAKWAELAQKMADNGHFWERRIEETHQEVEMATNTLNSLIEKVHDLGCELKDIDLGLVDFRSEQRGREIYLCWKLGEETIGWWHELEEGYSGRQPLEILQ